MRRAMLCGFLLPPCRRLGSASGRGLAGQCCAAFRCAGSYRRALLLRHRTSLACARARVRACACAPRQTTLTSTKCEPVLQSPRNSASTDPAAPCSWIPARTHTSSRAPLPMTYNTHRPRPQAPLTTASLPKRRCRLTHASCRRKKWWHARACSWPSAALFVRAWRACVHARARARVAPSQAESTRQGRTRPCAALWSRRSLVGMVP